MAIVMLFGWFLNMNILAPLVRSDALQIHPIVVTWAQITDAQRPPPSAPAEAPT